MFCFSVSLLAQRNAAPAARRFPRVALSCRRGLFGLLLSVLLLNGGAASAQTWTPVLNQNPRYYNGTMLLLTDGSVMVQSAWDFQSWTKLTPDATGSYVNGTWSTLASMSIPRQNFGSVVLTDGRVMVLGGEFSGPSLTRNQTNTGEIYNPVTNKWSSISPFPEPEFGAGPMVLHQYGYVLAGANTEFTHFYYPPGDFWFTFNGGINGDQKLRTDVSTEETWLLMPDGSVLSYDVNASITAGTATAQRFSSSSLDWTDSGTLPFLLTTPAQASKLGPATVLPNGKAIQIGGNEITSIYTPAPGNFGTGSWVTGPSLPAGMGADDAPGAMLPDGHFLFLADFYQSTSPTSLFDYNFFNNTLTDLSGTLPINLYYDLYFSASNTCRMLVLPNGGMLLTTGYYDLWEYKTSGSPLNSWRPVISSVSKVAGGRYSLSGSRLNGISEGATFGNEARMSSNYPIVRLDQVGSSRYARTTNWSAGISQPGVNNFQSVQFEVPPGLPGGTYYVSVITNGIQSLSTPVNITPGNVSASFAGGTLSVNGDVETNDISITYKQVKVSGVLTSASVTVASTDPFTTVNGTSSVTFNVGIERINANIQMGAGNDTVTVNSLFAKNVIANLGDGDDSVTFRYNSVSSQLHIDGGIGFDTATMSGNSIVKFTAVNVP